MSDPAQTSPVGFKTPIREAVGIFASQRDLQAAIDDLRTSGRCQVDEQRVLMTSGRLRCLCDISNRGDLTPVTEGGIAGGTVFNGGEKVTTELEVVVDAGVGGQELLSMAG